jgi:glycosyltransferase involved in cell wall biosynthesis
MPWVADFRDPWLAGAWMQLNAGGLPRSWTARMERDVIAGADLIIANAPAACASLQEAFPAHAEKIVTVTNGYDPETFEGLSRSRPAERWTLVHPGELYAGRNPRFLMEALGCLLSDWPADRPRPLLRLLGGGRNLDASFGEELRRLGLEEVVAREGHVPYRVALQAMIDADVLVLLDSMGRTTGVPAKLYEFLGAGRPILALAEPQSDTASVLVSSGVEYRMARPDDVPGIVGALRELADLPRDIEPAEGRLRFTRERLTGRLVEMLDRLVDQAEGQSESRNAPLGRSVS